MIINEKAQRQKEEDQIMQVMQDISSKFMYELEKQKQHRGQTEETLLNLLEETCSKL